MLWVVVHSLWGTSVSWWHLGGRDGNEVEARAPGGKEKPFARVTAGQFASPGCLYEVSCLSWVLPSSAAWNAGWEMVHG